ncbi:hypothetical protein HMPREF2130_11800 [Oligella urethralis DNF00040]|uniref:Lipoprotein n=2 Tax=Oligella urethralis TaxID=90245 RepID=A0A096A090_9BURK|nr:hypothetical protein CEQ07_04730 [Oligella urethralis]KGF24187.1 hypothetical protein HMPREF2130_11800 [Oligella urethralis DNF00040]OFV49755.1 hypothetical protein HMPREF3179_03505 [Oligella sp. HMSC09E12]
MTMKKVLVLLAVSLSTALVACGESPKDKNYYLKNIDKARAKKEECEAKMFQAAMSQNTNTMGKIAKDVECEAAQNALIEAQ